MKNEEFYQLVQSKSDKFNYALLSVTFATLALSFQFSPKMGNQWPWILIAAWVCYTASAFFGGLRLSQEVTHMRLNYLVNKVEAFVNAQVKNLKDPKFLMSLSTGNVLDDSTGKPFSKSQIEKNLEKEVKTFEVGVKNMNSAAKWLPLLFRFQFWILLIGVILNGVFVAKNFLAGTHCG